MARTGNQRMAGLAHSEIRAMTAACAQMKGINMAQGVCDTTAPEIVVHAAQRAMESGVNTYTRFDGLTELRQALAKKLHDYNGIIANPETGITISAGATGAFHCACLALLNPDDEVILFEPTYAYHMSAVLSVGAIPRIVSMRPPEWTFSLKDVERMVTSRTKAIVVNTPGNPSGKVLTLFELEGIAELAEHHDLFVLADEIYEYFLFDSRVHTSIASLPGMAERTITIGGYSKTFSITGWRIGYSVAHPRWAELIGAMNDLIYVCAPAPLQYGVAVGVRDLDQTFYAGLVRDYQAKRNRFCLSLNKAGLPPSVPQGAYYVLADVSRLPGKSDKARAMHLLDQTGIAGVPGEAFFTSAGGRPFMRFCFAKTDADLDEACRRIEQLG